MSTRRLAAVPDEPRRGLGLIRVSKTRGREDDLISPQLQRTAIEDYAARGGIHVVEWVEVLDESASRDRSPWWVTLDRVVQQIEAKELDAVLVWKYSRAARHRRRWAIAIDKIEIAGGTLESATEGLDTTTSTGRLARGMLAELAAWEAERIGESWKETQARRRSLGLPHGGHARWGYLYSREHGYTIDPETGPLLAEAYERYLAGEGHTTIAKWLNRRGVPSPRGAKTGWSVQAVIRVLDSGFGAGLIHRWSDSSWIDGAHHGVISAEQWARYRELRERRLATPSRVKTPSYPLTGLVKCGLCRKAMVASSNAKHGPGYMYRCTTRITSGADSCRGAWVTRAQVERRLLDWLQDLVDDVDGRAKNKTARVAAAAEMRLDSKAMTRELLRLEAAGERARGYLVDGTLTRAEYQVEKDRLQMRADELTKRLRDVRQDLEWLHSPAVESARGLLRDWPTLPVKDRRDLLSSMLRRVEVRPGVKGAQGLAFHALWEPDPWAGV